MLRRECSPPSQLARADQRREEAAVQSLVERVEELDQQGFLRKENEFHIGAAVFFLLHLALQPLCRRTRLKDDFDSEREWGMYVVNKASPCYQMASIWTSTAGCRGSVSGRRVVHDIPQ